MPLSEKLRHTLYARLAAAGALRAEHGRALGLFPTRRWPAQDASRQAQLRELITQALTQQAVPAARTAALIALLHALGREHKIVDPRLHGVSKRQLRERAQEIAKGSWASEAVRRAIDEVIAATVAAVAAASASAG